MDDIKNLHPLEIKVLNKFKSGENLTAEILETELDFKAGHANQVFSWLSMKNLLDEVSRNTTTYYEITELGKQYQENGTPEERIVDLLKSNDGLTLPEIAQKLQLDNKDVGKVFGALSKAKCVEMNDKKQAVFLKDSDTTTEVRKLLDTVSAKADGVVAESELSENELATIKTIAKKRGASDSMFKIVERDSVVFALNSQAQQVQAELKTAGITGDEIGQLTAESLKTGEWKKSTFRPYNINLPPARLIPGRLNAYASFLESVKDKLTNLGFQEMAGDLVETDFWNSDALFMPQFHAARDIHDVYYIKEPAYAKEIEEPFLTNVAEAHNNGGNTGSRGWNYTFDTEFTKRLLLRSQGTVCSARKLSKAEIPGKYFTVSRCFRYDKVDATHLSDFYQLDGMILGDDVNLRTLLGVLKMFALEIAGATEVKYVPAYFPFTEPSLELHVKHPVLGWFELGGAGIFRPEVTKSQGVDTRVLAWGLGIDRMALMALGINDLRELFSTEIETVRLRK